MKHKSDLSFLGFLGLLWMFIPSMLKSNSLIPQSEMPDSCITYSSTGEAVSKTIFLYNAQNLLTDRSDYAWSANKLQWLPTYQSTYSYDDNENLLSDMGFQYDASGESSFCYYQNVFSYSNENELLTQTYYAYDSLSQSLLGRSKYAYFYHSTGNLDSVIAYSEHRVATDSWIPSVKYIYGYTYDSIQSLSEIYNYDTSNNLWIKYIKSSKTYNSSAQFLSEENYTASDNQWMKCHRTDKEYLNGKLMQVFDYRSDGISDWKNFSKAEFAYNSDLIVSKITSFYQEGSSVWNRAFKDSMDYFSDNRKKKETGYSWADNSETWVAVSEKDYDYEGGNTVSYFFYSPKKQWTGTERTIVKYDSFGHLTSNEKYAWGETNSVWVPTTKTETIYDQETQKISSSTQSALGFLNSWQAYAMQTYEYETLSDASVGLQYIKYYGISSEATLSETGSKAFFYGNEETSIKNEQESNPVRIAWLPEEIIRITSDVEISRVSVFFVNGRQKYVGKQCEISTNNWEKGVYVVLVKTPAGKRVSKINIY